MGNSWLWEALNTRSSVTSIVVDLHFWNTTRPPSVDNTDYVNETYPYEVAMKIFEELNVMFRHSNFKHWLIVAGTVMWNLNDEKGR